MFLRINEQIQEFSLNRDFCRSVLLALHTAPSLYFTTEMPYLDDKNYNLYNRDVASQLTPNATQRTTLIVAGCYVIIIAILW